MASPSLQVVERNSRFAPGGSADPIVLHPSISEREQIRSAARLLGVSEKDFVWIAIGEKLLRNSER